MAVSTDPLSALYDALWAMLEAHSGLAALVRLNNRIKFSGASRAPLKDEISTADLPEMRLIVAAVSPHIERTSNSGSMLVRLEVQIATGEQRFTEAGADGVGAGLLPVIWETLRALHGWQTELASLTWNSKAYVVTCTPGVAEIGVNNLDLNRGIAGWSSVWACEVECWFNTADLQPTE